MRSSPDSRPTRRSGTFRWVGDRPTTPIGGRTKSVLTGIAVLVLVVIVGSLAYVLWAISRPPVLSEITNACGEMIYIDTLRDGVALQPGETIAVDVRGEIWIYPNTSAGRAQARHVVFDGDYIIRGRDCQGLQRGSSSTSVEDVATSD
ncbi:MAG: hypothetical protein GY926_26825 [bacterium]|nr:hypothetical protein [bacterium]